MKQITLFLFLLLSFPSLALAGACGILEFDSENMWEYNNGIFVDLDGNKQSDTVPSKKKLQFNTAVGLVSIEKAGSIKAKGKTTALKFSVKPKIGKTIQSLKSGKKLIGFFQERIDGSYFFLIDVEDGNVYKANVAAKGKIIFKLDVEAYFSPDDCRDDGPEL